MIDGNRQRPADHEDEEATARLLRMAGPRPEAAAERTARVRQAVLLHWRARARRNVIRRRVVAATAFLAAAATLVLIVRTRMPREDVVAPLGEVVATVERIEGEARRSSGTPGSRAVSSPLLRGDTLSVGEWVQTNATGRAALRLADRTSVRLDKDSRTRIVSASVIELATGATYFDTGHGSTGLEVRTAFGNVRDIGTQFEVRLDNGSLRLRVRTGIVELRRGQESTPAHAGTELVVSAGGIATGTFAPYGPQWEWASSLAPTLAIEGRPLDEFLELLCREEGWTLHYSDAKLARAASGIILHGSIEGLQAREALDVALTTSGLVYRFRDGDVLVVGPPSSQ